MAERGRGAAAGRRSAPRARAAALAAGERRALLGGVALTAFALLGLQVTLTRVLSVLLSYHYVFALVSLAMLGLGVGGLLAQALLARTARDTPARLPLLALLAGLAALLLVLAMHAAPRLAAVPAWGVRIETHLALLLPPFVLAGAVLATAFRLDPALAPRLYGLDLLGAAAGVGGAVLLLDRLGGIDATLALALALATAAVLFSLAAAPGISSWIARASLPAVALALGLGQAGVAAPEMPIGANPEKEIHDALAGPLGGRVVASRWSSFGRTDQVAFERDPGWQDLYLDGTAGTPMYRFSGDIDEPGEAVARLRQDFPGYFPLARLPPERRGRALVIGPGGGRDVLLARLAGIAEVLAVEVNPDLADLVEQAADYNGGVLHRLEGVELVVAEGRHTLRRQGGPFDLILLSLPVTHTSRSIEGFALTESFLLTVEAIGDYLDALEPGGKLVVVAHDEADVLRLLLLAGEALAARGLGTRELMRRVYLLGSFPYPTFVLVNRPLAAAEGPALARAMLAAGYGAASSYAPGIAQPGVVSPVLQAIEQGRLGLDGLERMVAARGLAIGPVRDDSPFFYHREHGPPAAVRSVLIGALALTLVAAFALSLGRGDGLAPGRGVILVLLLGVGFMLVEIALVQRFQLFLGQPVLTLATVLATLLVAAGLGSLAGGRVDDARLGRALAAIGPAVAVLALAHALAVPWLIERLLPLELPARLAVTAALLAPLGFAMGMPFPLVLRLVARHGQAGRIPALWALNGIASVTGAAAAVALAITHGFTFVLAAGALCYLLLLAACLTRKGHPIA